MSTSKTGKHGHAKVHMVALDIFTGKKLEDICPSTHNMDVPNVKRKDYQLLSMDDDFLSLMDDSGEQREDLKCPEGEIGEQIRAAIDGEQDIMCTVLSACGEESVIATKINTAVDKKICLYSGIHTTMNYQTYNTEVDEYFCNTQWDFNMYLAGEPSTNFITQF